jgi:hypothetical protein
VNDAVLVQPPGALAAEAALVAAAAAHAASLREAAAAGAPPAALARLLAAPLRVIVPSRSLREHASAHLARALGGAAAGVTVQTLRRLASEVLARAGVALTDADALFPVIVRREARREAALREALEPLRDGYATAAGSVADLLDAGFEPVLAEAALDALAAAPAALQARARAEALLRVAARTLRALEQHGLAHGSRAFARAAELLDERPELLPASGVVVHGFADATGCAGALLEALVRRCAARVLVDAPPDPAEPTRADPGVAFGERLRARLALAGARPEAPAAAPPPTPQLLLREAPGADAEARAVAADVRALLDAGAVPERIGIVARELAPYAAPLRRHLRRLAVPFSGAPDVASVALPAARALHALLRLLREHGQASVDDWLAARAAGAPPGHAGRRRRGDESDLRVALHALGAGRLADVAALDVAARLRGRAELRLPVGQGLVPYDATGGANDGDGAAEAGAAPDLRLRRRSVRARLLERTVLDARASVAALAQLEGRAALGPQRERLEELVATGLHWHAAAGPARALARALDGLAAQLPESFELDPAETTLLLERALAGAEAEPLGGAGGGVAVLSVVEARAHTFDALFVLGLGRDVFPRRPSDDALLPDALRRSLESVLPEIPLKARGLDEERYLFAQLVSSSPSVSLSWQTTSEEGRARAASPFVERLLLAGAALSRVPALFSDDDPARALRPAFEHAILAGLRAGEPAKEAALALALEEARAEEAAFDGVPAAALARARRRAREEWDAAAGARPLGPYLGFVGRRARRGPLHVTQLESFARCPWRSFLERDLGLAPLPDALAWRPGPDARLEGSALHAALEALVRAAAALPADEPLDAALGRAPAPFTWPDAARSADIVRRSVEDTLAEAGIGLPGYAEALARRIEPRVARARALLGESPRVVAVEARGAAALPVATPEGPLALHFRADLVERAAEGEGLVFSDYKGGANRVAVGADAGRRRSALARSVEAGLALQAMTYAFAADGASGRYLFLGDDVDEASREISVRAGDAELAAAFRGTVAALVGARAAGLHPPRLLTRDGAKAPPRCEWCEVREACARGDSGARARLRAWLEEGAHVPDPALESALRELWRRGDA